MTGLETTMSAAALGGAAAAGAFWGAFMAPRSGVCGPVIFRGSRDGPPRVALTFDDGPDGAATPRVLDLLERLEVKAAFFVIGRNVERWPELVRRMDGQGHLVANHSLDHANWGAFCGRGYWERQLGETDRLIEEIIGKRPALFRPPMGVRNWTIAGAARGRGQAVVTWTRRGMDGMGTMTDRIVDRLAPRACGGDILLMHDGVPPQRSRNAEASIAAVEPVVKALRGRGLRLVRLDELLACPGYQ